jgi:hypothetical protein
MKKDKAKKERWMVKVWKSGKLTGTIFPVIDRPSAEEISARYEKNGFTCTVSSLVY